MSYFGILFLLVEKYLIFICVCSQNLILVKHSTYAAKLKISIFEDKKEDPKSLERSLKTNHNAKQIILMSNLSVWIC